MPAAAASTTFFVAAGTVFNDTVRALTIYQGNLIAGGDFTAITAGPMNHIARLVFGSGWQAAAWVSTPLFTPFPAWHTELHVGGAFGEAGGVPAESWGRWNTTGAPAIYQDPSNQTTDTNCHATFTVTPSRPTPTSRTSGSRTACSSTTAPPSPAPSSLALQPQPFPSPTSTAPTRGVYTWPVSNGCGSTLSNAATLTVQCCGHADFNHDGDLGTDADIAAFFACLAGNCCPNCGSVDFNGDGDLGTDADIAAFFRILGGGGC